MIPGERSAGEPQCLGLQVSEFGDGEQGRFVFGGRAKEPGTSAAAHTVRNRRFIFIRNMKMKMILTTENRTFHDEDAKRLTLIIFHRIYNRIITEDRSNQNEAIMFFRKLKLCLVYRPQLLMTPIICCFQEDLERVLDN